MNTDTRIFKRLVLGIQPSAHDRTIQFAAQFADALRVDLLGLFLEDTSLHALADIPFSRELRLPGGGWKPLELARVSDEIARAAKSLERSFAQATKNIVTHCRFEVVRGATVETIASVSQSTDIVVVVEPANPAERATQQFAWLIESALSSAAAVLMVPAQIVRTAGAVAAVAATPNDPSLRTAAAIAAVANEPLVIVGFGDAAAGEDVVRTLTADTGLSVTYVRGGSRLSEQGIGEALRPMRERLIVATRGVVEPAVAQRVGSARRVPLLLVEPR